MKRITKCLTFLLVLGLVLAVGGFAAGGKLHAGYARRWMPTTTHFWNWSAIPRTYPHHKDNRRRHGMRTQAVYTAQGTSQTDSPHTGRAQSPAVCKSKVMRTTKADAHAGAVQLIFEG